MSGYAAIAWLDATDPTATDVLNIARLETSPVVYTWLEDGSFVWASTIAILTKALLRAGLNFGYIFQMDEGQMMGIRFGVPVDFLEGLKMTDDWEAYSRYSSATSGGHTTSKNHRNPKGIGASFGMRATDEGVWDDVGPGTVTSWEQDYRIRAGEVRFDVDDDDEVAMALAPETNEPSGRVWLRNADGELEAVGVDGRVDMTDENKGFYVTMYDGDLEIFEDLDKLEAHLSWLSNLTLPHDAPFPAAANSLRWVNQIEDIGDITVRGGMSSWLEDMARIDYYESSVVYNLDYIRDGVGDLITFLS
jgi:hypothetical protein